MDRIQVNVYSRLARQAVEHFVRQHEYLPLREHLSPELLRQGACFVTILEQPGQRFRSMHGHIMPTQATLAHEIVVNTVQALLVDPTRRANRADLGNLRCRVALLSPLMRVSDAQHLDPSRAGVYVRSDQNKSAVLLPGRVAVETADDDPSPSSRT